ncbi:YihY/virulence factor BrkB family protein [Bacteroides thetaiotaomicron]|nr:YihY/virulence factor BrkB family protein [Bacteroides thetaiotaomicron]
MLSFVNSYLSQTKGGIFIGVGLVMLLWTVINLVSNIEITFNRIWEVKKARSMYRKITDYFSMFLLMPILIVVSGGLSLFVSTVLKQMDDFVLLAPVMKFMIRLIPFVLTWLMFTGLYIFMPNTKVKFKHALIAGILAGSLIRLSSSCISTASYGYRNTMLSTVASPLSPCFCSGCKSHGPSVCSELN